MKTECFGTDCHTSSSATAAEFNQACYCKTLDRDLLTQILLADDVNHDLLATHPQLFSNIASFIKRQDADSISTSIAAIERVIALTVYRQQALAHAHPHAQFNPGTAGVFSAHLRPPNTLIAGLLVAPIYG